MSAQPSEFKHGWRVLLGSFLGIAAGVSSIYFYSLGVFIKPLAATYGWGRGEASLGALVGTAGAALMAIPMGRLVDRMGSLQVAIGSLVLLAAGFAALAGFTSNLATFLVVTALLSLLTAGSSPLPYTRLVVASFDRQRGIALGIVLAGTGLGAIVTPALLTPYVAQHGWRAGYLMLAAVVLCATPVVWWCLRGVTSKEPVRSRVIPLAELASNTRFQRLAVIFFLASLAVFGAVVQFVPMLMDGGLSPAKAGGAAAMIGVSAIIGRLMTGLLLDRFSALRVTFALMVTSSAGLALLAIGGAALAIPGALVIGLAVGAEVDLIAYLVGRYFPKPAYGQFYGAIYAVFLLGGAIGPAVSGYLREGTGDYRVSLLTAAGLLAVAGVVALFTASQRRADGSPFMSVVD